jgi:NAD(P)-dependent dehydrogenase (short-subunit alcohol dehydrogenase family)
VNAVNPGLIDTPVARDVVDGDERACADIAKNVPIGRAGRPEEIASTVLWLCSPVASLCCRACTYCGWCYDGALNSEA